MRRLLQSIFAFCLVASTAAAGTNGFIQIAPNRPEFIFEGSAKRFVPWGFNYDHDSSGRLIEEYWNGEWDTVAEDFREMKALGANCVRIHLQIGRFLRSPTEPNTENLRLLARTVSLAATNGLYLNITGLGCYDKATIPPWYDQLSESDRWDVQARFWELVAATCKDSPNVFCYDLMNEPVVASGKPQDSWLAAPLGKFHFVQRINLDPAGREPKEIARAWIDRLVSAIRKHDTRHLITVGVIPWGLTFRGAKPLFHSPEVGAKLDFVSVHFYPETKKGPEALEVLATFKGGKPIVIEEMFPLKCSVTELDEFVEGSKPIATGWFGFYWGKSIPEYEQLNPRDIAAELTLQWLRYFQRSAAVNARP